MHRGVLVQGSRVLADLCPRDGGIWLDGGELEELVRELRVAAACVSREIAGLTKLDDEALYRTMGTVVANR